LFPRNDKIREVCRKRLAYVRRLAQQDPEKYLKFINSVVSASDSATSLRDSSPPINPINPSTSRPDSSPPINPSDSSPIDLTSDSTSGNLTAESPPELQPDLSSTMSSLGQIHGPFVINTSCAEKNGDVFIFKMDDVYAYGKRFNVRQFVKPLSDPRMYPSLEVGWHEDNGIFVKDSKIPTVLTGEDGGRNVLLGKMMDKTAEEMVETGMTDDDAATFAVAAGQNLIVFSNAMGKEPSTSYNYRVFTLPDGQTFRKDFLGNTKDEIAVYVSCAQVTRGKAVMQCAVAYWFVALEGADGLLVTTKKKTKAEELAEELEG